MAATESTRDNETDRQIDKQTEMVNTTYIHVLVAYLKPEVCTVANVPSLAPLPH